MATLGKPARAAALEAEKRLLETGENPDHHRAAIERYAHAVDEEFTVRAGWELDGCPVHAVGSAGQLCAHPLLKALRDAEAHASDLAKALGLLPERRVGRPKGASQAADRQTLRRAA